MKELMKSLEIIAKGAPIGNDNASKLHIPEGYTKTEGQTAVGNALPQYLVKLLDIATLKHENKTHVGSLKSVYIRAEKPKSLEEVLDKRYYLIIPRKALKVSEEKFREIVKEKKTMLHPHFKDFIFKD